MSRLILFNKPFGVLSQFTDTRGRPTLGQYITEPGFYVAGRLDFDSEGLLVLCDDGSLQHQIASPRYKLPKTYLVQVEGSVSPQAIAALGKGVQLNDGMTRPAEAAEIAEPALWPRLPPVRHRAHIPTSWLKITLREGRNRQVRRMTAALGFPTLRLVRWRIGDWAIDGIQPGELRWETVNLPRRVTIMTRTPRKK